MKCLAAILCLLCAFTAQATTWTATNGTETAVEWTVTNLAQPGDTVLIPAATNSWNHKLLISGITLQGSGTNSTEIIDETPTNTGGIAVIQMNILTNGFTTHLTGIQFHGGTTNTSIDNFNGVVQVFGPDMSYDGKIDNNMFVGLTGKNIHVIGPHIVICDNYFNIGLDIFGIEVNGFGYGDLAWARPVQWGSSNACYIERNTFYTAYYPNVQAGIDVANGAETVVRYNTWVNCWCNTHGTETSGRFRSSRYLEFYNNNMTWGPGTSFTYLYTAIDFRGGDICAHDNYAWGYNNFIKTSNFRATDNDTSFAPFYGATTTNAYDNFTIIATGIVTSAGLTLIDSGQNWTANQFVGDTVFNSVSNRMGMVNANTATSMTFITSRTAIYQVGFKIGDPYVIGRSTTMLDQPSAGAGALLSTNAVPIATNLNQAVECMYSWNNLVYTIHNSPVQIPDAIAPPYGNLIAGLNYSNDVAKAGYSTFTYPFPGTGGSGGGGTTNASGLYLLQIQFNSQ